MDGPGDEVLAHAAFPANQDRRIRVGDVFDDRADCPHRRAALEKRDMMGETRLATIHLSQRTVSSGGLSSTHVRLLREGS